MLIGPFLYIYLPAVGHGDNSLIFVYKRFVNAKLAQVLIYIMDIFKRRESQLYILYIRITQFHIYTAGRFTISLNLHNGRKVYRI